MSATANIHPLTNGERALWDTPEERDCHDIRNRSEANAKLVDIYNTMRELSDQITEFVQGEYVWQIVLDCVAAGLMMPDEAADEYTEGSSLTLLGDLVSAERNLDGFQRMLDLLADTLDSCTTDPPDENDDEHPTTVIAVEGGVK